MRVTIEVKNGYKNLHTSSGSPIKTVTANLSDDGISFDGHNHNAEKQYLFISKDDCLKLGKFIVEYFTEKD